MCHPVWPLKEENSPLAQQGMSQPQSPHVVPKQLPRKANTAIQFYLVSVSAPFSQPQGHREELAQSEQQLKDCFLSWGSRSVWSGVMVDTQSFFCKHGFCMFFRFVFVFGYYDSGIWSAESHLSVNGSRGSPAATGPFSCTTIDYRCLLGFNFRSKNDGFCFHQFQFGYLAQKPVKHILHSAVHFVF